jgi:hypothetical protein
LNSVTAFRDVVGDGAGLGIGHEAAGAERAAELADQRHEIGRGDGDVEVEKAALDAGHEVFGTDHIGACFSRGRRLVALGEHRDPYFFAGARRQADGASHHLVGLARIDAEASHDVDRLVELAVAEALDQRERLGARVLLFSVEVAQRFAVLFSLRHGDGSLYVIGAA